MYKRPALSPAEIVRGLRSRRFARHYHTSGFQFLANLKANPDVANGRFADVHVHLLLSAQRVSSTSLMLKSIEEEIRDQFEAMVPLADALGREVLPGFRLMESRAHLPTDFMNGIPAIKPTGWDDAWQWADNTKRLYALLQSMERMYGSMVGQRIVFDIEDYMGSMPSVDEARMKVVLAPFIELLQKYQVIPCFYPAEIDGGASSCAQTVILDAVMGRAELWTESAYFLADALRRNRDVSKTMATIAAQEYRARRRWPGIHFHHGHQIRMLRDWFTDAQRVQLDMTPGVGWFDESSDRSDNRFIGTPEWVAGTTANRLNNSKYRYAFPPLSRGTPLEERGGPSLIVSTPLPGVKVGRDDLTSTKGYLTGGARALSGGKGLLPAGPYALMVEVEVPVGQPDGPLVARAQPNGESWQVVLTSDLLPWPDGVSDEAKTLLAQPRGPQRLELQVRLAVPAYPGTIFMQTMSLGAPVFGKPLRIGISLPSNMQVDWCVAANGATSSGTLALAKPTAATANLWLGAGTVLGSTRIQTYSDGLVFSGLEVWHESLPLADLEQVTLKPFPRFS